MRVDLLAPPFRGHLHPILGLALELAPGHDVRVLSTPGTMAEIAACGLAGRTLLTVEDERRLERISNPGHTVGSHPVRLLRQLRATLDVLGDARAALDARYADDTERPDLLIADFTLPIAGVVAARLGIPWWTALPSPCVLETRAGPPAYLGGLAPMTGPLGRLRDGAARRLVRLFKRGVGRLERERFRALGIEAIYRADGTESAYSPECILALGLASFELGRGWPRATRFVGPPLVTPPSTSAAPPFRTGRRHVLVSCGTHLSSQRAAFAEAAAALARARPDLEVHVSAGQVPEDSPSEARMPSRRRSSNRAASTAPTNLVHLPWVDYARHVSRYAAVVHHGGAGILWRCLADGVPAVVVPVDYDQPDNAVRLEHAGLAVRAHLGRSLEPAVARALDERALARRCRDMARRIACEHRARPVRELVAALARRLPTSAE